MLFISIGSMATIAFMFLGSGKRYSALSMLQNPDCPPQKDDLKNQGKLVQEISRLQLERDGFLRTSAAFTTNQLWESSIRDFLSSEIQRVDDELKKALTALEDLRKRRSYCRSQAEEEKPETSDEDYFSSFDHTSTTEDLDSESASTFLGPSESARSSLSPSEEAELWAHSLELGDYNAVEPNTVVEVQPGTNAISPEDAELVSEAIQMDEQIAKEPQTMKKKSLRPEWTSVSTDFMEEPYAYASTSSRRVPTYQEPIKSKSKTWKKIVQVLPFKSIGQSSWFSPKD